MMRANVLIRIIRLPLLRKEDLARGKQKKTIPFTPSRTVLGGMDAGFSMWVWFQLIDVRKLKGTGILF